MQIIDGIKAYQKLGLNSTNATSAFCQDLILRAISKSTYFKNITIKGGVAMRNFTKDVRRATLDLDIDFINLSISEEQIQNFIGSLCYEDFRFEMNGKTEELKQQDYHGKRVHIKITDSTNHSITTKIDIGVHNYSSLIQNKITIDLLSNQEKFTILSNSKEQIFTEKTKALLRLGNFSTRYKDIFDMYWLKEFINTELLKNYIDILIFKDASMKENSIQDIFNRFEKILADRNFKQKLRTSNKNWVNEDIDKVATDLLQFIKAL